MTFAEFHAAVVRAAAGSYCCTKAEITTRPDGGQEIEFGGYIHGDTWHYSDDPNRVIAALSGFATEFTAEQLGDLPELPHPTTDHTSEF